MTATIPWNRSGVPVETTSPAKCVVFIRRLPHALFFLGSLMAGVAGVPMRLLWGSRLRDLSLYIALIFGLFAFLLLLEALRRVWSQRTLIVDLERREIVLLRRNPWKASSLVYPFSSLRRIWVDSPEDRPNPVLLVVEGDRTILLGQDFDQLATPFARRLAGLTGIPFSP